MRLPDTKSPLVLVAVLGLVAVLTPNASAQSAAPECRDVAFIPNAGQWQDPVDFMARTGPMTTWFTAGGWTFTLQEPVTADDPGASRAGVAVRMSFVGAQPDVTPRGAGRHASRHNFYSDAAAVDGVSAAARLVYDDLYEGVDVLVRPNQGRLEYDVRLAAGADLDAVAVRLEGADGYDIDDAGALVMATALGPVVQPAPLTWTVLPDGSRREVACGYRRIDAHTFGFSAPDWNRELPLVVDPQLTWATYLGGSNFDYVQAVQVEDDDTVTVAGFTTVTGFPTTTGAFDTSFNGNRDIFVARLSSDGSSLLYSTYIGGSGNEEPQAMAMMPGGGVVLTGWTSSINFPTTAGAHDTSHNGGGPLLGSDVFVVHLSAGGGGLVYSSYLGGSSDETGTAVFADAQGQVTVAGRTASFNFPTTPGAFDTSYGGGSAEVGDMFVTRLAPGGGSLAWSTFVGGSNNDNANSLCVDSLGRAVVAGWSMSSNYPTTAGAYDTTLGGFSDAVMTRITADGSGIDMSTFLGGHADENGTTLWLDGLERLLLAGTTLSTNFPTTVGAVSSSYSGGAFYGDVFVTCFDADGTALEYATYLGGSGDDYPTALRTDGDGAFHVAGWTVSSDFPVTPDALDDTLGGSTDVFYSSIFQGELVTSTYLGGNSPDKALDMAVTPAGRVTLAGWTTSSAFPVTSGSLDGTFGGIEGFVSDAFVARLDVGSISQALGTFTELGFALPGFGGLAPAMEWNGSMVADSFGQVDFSDARPSTLGLVFVGYAPGAMAFAGGTFVPFPYAAFTPFVTNGAGTASVGYHWPAGVPSDLTLYVQSWLVDADAPAGFSATEAWQLVTP